MQSTVPLGGQLGHLEVMLVKHLIMATLSHPSSSALRPALVQVLYFEKGISHGLRLDGCYRVPFTLVSGERWHGKVTLHSYSHSTLDPLPYLLAPTH